MRKTIFAIAFALAVVGAGIIAGSMGDPEPAEAKCSSTVLMTLQVQFGFRVRAGSD